LRTVDWVRGAIIGLISLVAGFWILRPAAESGRAPVSGGQVALIAIAIGLQVAVFAGTWLARRWENARGMPGAISPHALHVLQLLADGVTVLLFALAVFGGIAGAALAI
jgi:hypothetical protein